MSASATFENSSYTCVSFDVGGTLLRPHPSVGQVYSDVAKTYHGRRVCPDRLDSGFLEVWASRRDFEYTADAWRLVVEETFRLAEGPEVDPELFESIYQRFISPEVWRVHTDVEFTLEALKQAGTPTLVISNWDERLHPLLEGMGLDGWFDRIFVSCDLGHKKPSPEIFQMAAERMEFDPSQILHVGDCPNEDFEAAIAAGFQARLIDRSRARVGNEGVISSLCDLIPVSALPPISLDSSEA